MAAQDMANFKQDRVRNLEQKVSRADEEIAKRVYVLYRLSPDEIRTVDVKE